MQCEDNAKLRTPLKEVCDTTDIGCVPIVNGKPTYNPQPDELPIAFDQSSTTLWLFSCKTHSWVAFKKFRLDELSDINLDNIRNICDVLNIAVWYDSGSAHVQGTVTLGELAEQILKCIRLKTNAVVVNSDTAKISIQGLESLPPFFVKGENIWFTGGSGTETDPFRVKTHDPICNWPTKSRAQVDAANVKHLGACLDGQMSRVPFPPEVCELPSKSEAQVRASSNKQMIACIDGEGAKVPFPKEVCELDGLSQEQVDASSNKTLIACVNGKGAKVPYIESDPPICELPLVTTSQVSSNSNATMAVCLDGKSSRMPVPSGMFVPEYICVPKVTAKPTSPPDFGTGPLRMGCDDELYVWLCDEKRWQMVTLGHNKLPQLDINDVADPCNNLKFFGWYRADSEECNQNRYVTLCQLAEIIKDTDTFNSIVNQIATEAANICKLPARTAVQITQAGNNASVPVCVDGTNARTTVSNLATVLGSNSNLVNTVTNNVTNSGTFGVKVNEIVKNNVNENTNNLTSTIIDKVVDSNRLQNPICSLSNTTRNSVNSNWNNTTVPICENGISKKIGINDFYTVIIDRYVPPDNRECNLIFTQNSYQVIGAGGINAASGGRHFRKFTLNNITLERIGTTGVNMAIYGSARHSFVKGSGTILEELDENWGNVSGTSAAHSCEIEISLRNTTSCRVYYDMETAVQISKVVRNEDYSILIFAKPSLTSKEEYSDAINLQVGNPLTNANFTNYHAVFAYHSQEKDIIGGSWDYTGNFASVSRPFLTGKSPSSIGVILNPGESIKYYLQFWLVIASNTLTGISTTGNIGPNCTTTVRTYRGLYI